MKISGSAILYAVAAIALGAGAWYVIRRAQDIADGVPTVDDVIDAVNPASEKNIVYRAANWVAEKVTGNTVDTIGTRLAAEASDAAGVAATTPIPVMKPMRAPTGEGISFDEFMSNAKPVRPGQLAIDGSGGAAFGLYPNPFRSKP